MNSKVFTQVRKSLGKTQTQLAELLCVSPKAIQSFEQGWRRVPTYIEREMLVLLALNSLKNRNINPCWETKNCPAEWRNNCIVWYLQTNHLCWFVSGVNCEGKSRKSWSEKIRLCKDCKIFQSLFAENV